MAYRHPPPAAPALRAFEQYDVNRAVAAAQTGHAASLDVDCTPAVVCPVCRGTVRRVGDAVGRAAGEVDACGAHGGWFDRHELTGILESLARPGDLPTADTRPNSLVANVKNAIVYAATVTAENSGVSAYDGDGHRHDARTGIDAFGDTDDSP